MRPKYYYQMLLYVSKLTCPELAQLKHAIKQIEKERSKNAETKQIQ